MTTTSITVFWYVHERAYETPKCRRLFQQVRYSHNITILLQPCVVNLVTTIPVKVYTLRHQRLALLLVDVI